jgi:AraC family transcriptional regulator
VLAGVACLSRFHLIRMFRQVYGETPLRFLTRLRMEEACRRLALGDDAIANIAADCGYVNPTHFAAAFRRVVGVTPREYRLRCARERTTWQFGDTGEQSSGVASPDSLLVSRTTGEDTP